MAPMRMGSERTCFPPCRPGYWRSWPQAHRVPRARRRWYLQCCDHAGGRREFTCRQRRLRVAGVQAQEDTAARSAAIMLLHCCAAPLQPAAALLLLAPGPDLAGPAPTAEAPAAPRDPSGLMGEWQGGPGLGLQAAAACPPAAQRHVLAAAAARALDAALSDCGDWAACQVRAHALPGPAAVPHGTQSGSLSPGIHETAPYAACMMLLAGGAFVHQYQAALNRLLRACGCPRGRPPLRFQCARWKLPPLHTANPAPHPLIVQGPRRAAALLELLADYTAAAPAASAAAAVAAACAPALRRAAAALARAGPPAGWTAPAAALLAAWLRLLAVLGDRCQARRPAVTRCKQV